MTEVMKLTYNYSYSHVVNLQTDDGNTPLHLACYYGDSKIIEALMLAGADETITNDNCQTPAKRAIAERHEKVLKLLDRSSLWTWMIRREKMKNWQVIMLTVVVLLPVITKEQHDGGIRVYPV